MKKSVFLLGLLAIAGVCLTACETKNYEMSFDEALEIASHSTLHDILANNENIQQNFGLSTNVNVDWTNAVVNLESNSKQNTENSLSDSSIKFDVNLSNEDMGNIVVDWYLNIKLVDENLYLSLSSLNLTWSEVVAYVVPMVEWFKNQRFYMPMSGLNDASKWYLKTLDDTTAKEVVMNEGSVVYEWKFTQFNWYNARKISLNNEKLQEIINEYYKSINTLEDEEIEAPQLNIENFEGYLVITWKDKVAIVVDNMDIVDEESTVNANWFGGDDYLLNLSGEWEDSLTMTANRKWSNYEISLNVSDAMFLNWTLSPKVSKSSINIKFDVKVTLKSEWEDDVIVPLKGSWVYEPISSFEVTAPENAQDLTELLQDYLWAMLWGDSYDYDDSDYYYDDEEYEGIDTDLVESEESQEATEEIVEQVEAVEEIETSETEAE